MEKTKEPDFRETFLENFIESLILNTKSKEDIIQKSPKEEIPHQIIEFKAPQLTPNINPAPQGEQTIQPRAIQMQSRQTQVQNNLQPTIQQRIGQPTATSRGKIEPLLRDPGILSIECPGPRRNIVINKYGIIQTISMNLEQQEINEIINEISKKTKIPIIQGTFRAAIGNIIITAIISEFVGTRFIIEKKPAQIQQFRR